MLHSINGLKKITSHEINLSSYLTTTNFKEIETDITDGPIPSKIKFAIRCRKEEGKGTASVTPSSSTNNLVSTNATSISSHISFSSHKKSEKPDYSKLSSMTKDLSFDPAEEETDLNKCNFFLK